MTALNRRDSPLEHAQVAKVPVLREEDWGSSARWWPLEGLDLDAALLTDEGREVLYAAADLVIEWSGRADNSRADFASYFRQRDGGWRWLAAILYLGGPRFATQEGVRALLETADHHELLSPETAAQAGEVVDRLRVAIATAAMRVGQPVRVPVLRKEHWGREGERWWPLDGLFLDASLLTEGLRDTLYEVAELVIQWSGRAVNPRTAPAYFWSRGGAWLLIAAILRLGGPRVATVDAVRDLIGAPTGRSQLSSSPEPQSETALDRAGIEVADRALSGLGGLLPDGEANELFRTAAYLIRPG